MGRFGGVEFLGLPAFGGPKTQVIDEIVPPQYCFVMTDPRKGNALYYDLDDTPLDDIPFYLNEVHDNSTVLELGCGTGRTLIPIAAKCKEIVGVDYSADMVERCKAKIPANISEKCKVLVGDITNLILGRQFDLLVAPFRVMQALESDKEVNGFFSSIERHLGPSGSCILNVFNPYATKSELIKNWPQTNETICWEEVLLDGSRVVHSEYCERISENPLVLFPQLIYRKYKGENLVDEFVQKIKMRCYYPDEFKTLIKSFGFHIADCWGGYNGEKYGVGKELVVKITSAKRPKI